MEMFGEMIFGGFRVIFLLQKKKLWYTLILTAMFQATKTCFDNETSSSKNLSTPYLGQTYKKPSRVWFFTSIQTHSYLFNNKQLAKRDNTKKTRTTCQVSSRIPRSFWISKPSFLVALGVKRIPSAMSQCPTPTSGVSSAGFSA